MMLQINLRVPPEVVEDLDHLAAQDHLTRIDVARQILLEGVAQRKQALAVRLYSEGKVSKTRAAEMAGVSLWEMMDLLDEADVAAMYSLREAVENVRRVVEGVTAYQAVTPYRRVAEEAQEQPYNLHPASEDDTPASPGPGEPEQ